MNSGRRSFLKAASSIFTVISWPFVSVGALTLFSLGYTRIYFAQRELTKLKFVLTAGSEESFKQYTSRRSLENYKKVKEEFLADGRILKASDKIGRLSQVTEIDFRDHQALLEFNRLALESHSAANTELRKILHIDCDVYFG